MAQCMQRVSHTYDSIRDRNSNKDEIKSAWAEDMAETVNKYKI